MKKVLFPGSFDPITKAHLNIIKRLIKLGFYVEVGILDNKNKQNMFHINDRISILNEIKKNYGFQNINIFFAEGLLVNICENRNIDIVVRGLRNLKDYEYEKEMELNNKILNDKLEYLYLNTKNELMSISSTVVRELIHYDADISHLVPQEVINNLEKNNL